MRQAGILAAAGLIALEEMPARLHEDHANARLLAEAVAELPSLLIDMETVQTNIVIFEVTGQTAAEAVAKLKARGLLTSVVGPQSVRFVTHADVTRQECERAAEIVRAVLA